MSDITRIMADHGIIPAETLNPIEVTHAAAGQFGHPADGWLIHKSGRGWYRPNARGYTSSIAEAGRYSHEDAMSYSHPSGWDGPRDEITIRHESDFPAAHIASDHSGDANKKVAALIERMERIVRNKYAHRDVLIHNCDLGQITFGDVRDLCDAVRTIPAVHVQDRAEVELVTDADKLRSPATGMSRDSRGAADAYRQGLVTARVIVSRRALELDAEGYPESKMKASVLANVANEISAIIDLALAAGPTLPPMMEVDHIVRNAQDEKRAALRANDALTAERDALKAEVEELRMALQAEIMFSDFVAAKFRVNPDKLCLTVHVRPDGQEVATDRKPDGSEAASITWAEVHAASRIALRAERKGGAA